MKYIAYVEATFNESKKIKQIGPFQVRGEEPEAVALKNAANVCNNAKEIMLIALEKYPLSGDSWTAWKGLTVRKRSGKPFKSGKKTAVVKELVMQPGTGSLLAFEEDDSLVSAEQCILS